ncbi:MAG: pyridoxal phosphate-dependent aminotransferase [Micromonosporaceae bacterium]|nr:pyridoxal phosphate-dependent aminotransferase [Micromonosporaceae bacterium]
MNDPVLATRLRDFGVTVFAEMTALAKQTGALNLGQGFPDSSGPPAVLEAARQAIADGVNQYPPGSGLPQLRNAVAEQRDREYGTAYDPETEVLVTFGATEAIAASLLAFCEPGDEVAVFEPYYDSYAAGIAMAGAQRRAVKLTPTPTGFVFDPDELRRAITSRTRVLLLNSPHNPTGKVFDRRELELIASLCQQHDLIAVTDEVYEYLTYDDFAHHTIASLPGMRERTVAISSGGKTYSVTGWKVGWLCAPKHLVDAVRTVKQYLTFAGGGPFQLAICEGLANQREWVEQLRLSLQTRRDRLSGELTAAGVEVYPAQGTYFLQIDVRPFGYDDTDRFCRELPLHAGVVAVPSTAFYDSKETARTLARLAFCKSEEVLAEAAERLVTFAKRG